LTSAIEPSNAAARRFLSTARPGEVARGLAPTTATDRGENTFSIRYVDICQINQEGFGDSGSAPIARGASGSDGRHPRVARVVPLVSDICGALKNYDLMPDDDPSPAGNRKTVLMYLGRADMLCPPVVC
jgi:hypothetical protein